MLINTAQNKIRTLLTLAVLSIILPFSGKTQIAYSPVIDSLISLTNEQSIILLTRQLSGDTTVLIDGQIKTIRSRHYNSPDNLLAAKFIYQKFQEYGYEPEYHYFYGTRGINVIATKVGTRYPDQEYIICGHYDNMPSGSLAPGADDNASGTVAVLEAARILKNMPTDYTIRFAAWDEEEIGLIGSHFYAQRAYNNGQNILGVLNLDMIAWDSNNDMLFSIATNSNSQAFSNDFVLTNSYYQPQLSHNFINTTASDHASFWEYGYPAILAIEDFNDFNAYYHTTGDNMSILNMPIYIALVKASLANIASQGLNYRFNFNHNPIISSINTLPREAYLVVNSDYEIDYTNYQPLLYHSADNSEFVAITPEAISNDTIKFIIPGYQVGTSVRYYFAVQDVNAQLAATHPIGGKGISPAGTISPSRYFSYEIANYLSSELCSNQLPIAIPDNSSVPVIMNVNIEGELVDLDVQVDITHPRTADIRMILLPPTGSAYLLTDRNGASGSNYTNTFFDDQAAISIKEGSAPFNGRFRPETSFQSYKGKPIAGSWRLQVSDLTTGNLGTINQWCLHFLYKDLTIGVTNIDKKELFSLEQNYPNPAGDQTSIKFHLSNQSQVKLSITDMNGKVIKVLASGSFKAGDHLIVASVSDLKPGKYLYTLEVESNKQTRQLLIVR